MQNIKSILVVDDNVISRLLPGLILRPFGWSVYESDGGLDALEKLKNLKVSCVLLDISMPQITGIEVLKSIRNNKEYDELVIVAYTAFATDDDVSKFKQSGFDEVLIKPLTSRKLLDLLRKY